MRHQAKSANRQPARSTRASVNPYWIDEVTFTIEEIRRSRAGR